MPPNQSEIGTPADWLRHARSDLALVRVEQETDVLLETLCFHAQQTAEKSLKAVLLREGIEFPYTHDIARLITLVHKAKIPWNEELDQAAELTGYAVEGRYPGSAETVSEEEYRQALAIAERVLIWAENIIEPTTQEGS
jgi:HEPN domain-containing protein